MQALCTKIVPFRTVEKPGVLHMKLRTKTNDKWLNEMIKKILVWVTEINMSDD